VLLYGKSLDLTIIAKRDMPEDEWGDYADPHDIPDDPDDWRSESDED